MAKKMMGEPDWHGATPWSHKEPVPHSGGGKHQGKKHAGERPSMPKPTSMNMQMPTKTELPNLAGHDKVPAKMEMATPMSHFKPVNHSGPHHGHPPVKSWKKKGYSMDVPSVESPASEKRNGGSSLS